jgi:enoyl-CoA hydratase/carnithine racemase
VEPQLSPAERLAAQFNEDLQSIGLKKKKTSADIAAEVRLEKMFRAVRSVQASNVEAEKAFSSVGRFVTKIRNWLGDALLTITALPITS